MSNKISFERCIQIRKAGNEYREGTLQSVSDVLGISKTKSRELVVDFVKLTQSPSEDLSMNVVMQGVMFFGKCLDVNEISEKEDIPEEEVRENIRQYSTITLRERESESIDLRTVTLPDGPIIPDPIENIENRIRTPTLQSIENIQRSINSLPESGEVRESLQEISNISHRISKSLEGLNNLSKTVEQLQESLRPAIRAAIEEGISNREIG